MDTKASTSEVAAFCSHYGEHQMITSFIWSTKPADAVALSLGLDPAEVLRPLLTPGGHLGPASVVAAGATNATTAVAGQKAVVSAAAATNAAMGLKAQGCGAVRSMVASVVALTQVVRTSSAALQTGERFGTRASSIFAPVRYPVCLSVSYLSLSHVHSRTCGCTCNLALVAGTRCSHSHFDPLLSLPLSIPTILCNVGFCSNIFLLKCGFKVLPPAGSLYSRMTWTNASSESVVRGAVLWFHCWWFGPASLVKRGLHVCHVGR
jgi:hypothetical protein